MVTGILLGKVFAKLAPAITVSEVSKGVTVARFVAVE